MSTERPTPPPTQNNNTPLSLPDAAAMENFVRLQRSQMEYLAWLETLEHQPDTDCYSYRKIR